jgi:uncharacterized protein (TIGR02594 family)
MITRRTLTWVLGSSAIWASGLGKADTVTDHLSLPLEDLLYPPFEALTAPKEFGYKEPSKEDKDMAEVVIKETPRGPTAIAIMQSFIKRYYETNPKLISQWPTPEPWNPLVVEFFKSTSTPANNDMVPWCAASANWCIERANGKGSRSASSQSFLKKPFQNVKEPKVGDLAVFTCYDKATGKNTGLGHVGFVAEKPTGGAVLLVGGNTAKDGHSSIICERYFQIDNRDVWRHIGSKRVLCTMRLNSYVAVV